jgi:hypothetical protein
MKVVIRLQKPREAQPSSVVGWWQLPIGRTSSGLSGAPGLLVPTGGHLSQATGDSQLSAYQILDLMRSSADSEGAALPELVRTDAQTMVLSQYVLPYVETEEELAAQPPPP